MGWQWTAGCGADAAPYYRTFNPILQTERFDPERRKVPELAPLPDRRIHQPWAAPEAVLAAAGVRLGSDYPAQSWTSGIPAIARTPPCSAAESAPESTGLASPNNPLKAVRAVADGSTA